MLELVEVVSLYPLSSTWNPVCELSTVNFYSQSLSPLHHPLHHFIGSRAVFNILFVNMHVIDHLSFSMMWKPGAVCWSYFVDLTLVIREVEELTGLRFIHPVAIGFIEVQPFILKLAGGYFQRC